MGQNLPLDGDFPILFKDNIRKTAGIVILWKI